MYQHDAFKGLPDPGALASVSRVTRPRRPRLIATATFAAAVALAGPAQAFAAHPSSGGKPGKKPPPASTGYDVSYPQCSSILPSSPQFGVVGVNGGKPYSANSCLA